MQGGGGYGGDRCKGEGDMEGIDARGRGYGGDRCKGEGIWRG